MVLTKKKATHITRGLTGRSTEVTEKSTGMKTRHYMAVPAPWAAAAFCGRALTLQVAGFEVACWRNTRLQALTMWPIHTRTGSGFGICVGGLRGDGYAGAGDFDGGISLTGKEDEEGRDLEGHLFVLGYGAEGLGFE